MTDTPKAKAKERLQKALDAIPGLKRLANDSSEFEKWHRNTEVAIANTFGEKSRHVKDFTTIHYSPMMFTAHTPDSTFQRLYVSGLDSAGSVLQSMIEEIEEYWDDGKAAPTAQASSPQPAKELITGLRTVFLIHGHDDGSKETVARFLSKLGLEPVILHEQPNQGRTIIEKFERHSQVGFAIALLTPDDVGGLTGAGADQLRPRARQNVIFEFGYFMGKLGRHSVCALTKGNVELPSDYSGVLYIPLDVSGAWRMTLVRELKAAGYDVDANLAL
jgi:predicted nucleotide-binding protein